ncbi:UTP-glucose-1-phosphate uridylyltransferase [Marasmius crinis-equi]|uniref:UTP--glucose-1-phosphate uridylyltransferase n=1 Tax=Marasmius crinis-equi TaxID=585013 RepID=A0ABR3FDX7_9AGAR
MPAFSCFAFSFQRLASFFKLFSARPPTGSDDEMSYEIQRLADTLSKPIERRGFYREMQSFLELYSRYVEEKRSAVKLDWTRMAPAGQRIVSFDSLDEIHKKGKALNKLAILKVNGGLGLTGAKGALEVKDGLTFLDLTIRQIQHLNKSFRVDVPLLFMTSFSTYEDTINIIQRYANNSVNITAFNQSRYPRFFEDTLTLCPADADASDRTPWYPPGHGDMYAALHRSGVLDRLLSDGKEYLFVSNSDNLGATVDMKILDHMVTSRSEFLMEVTDKTRTDVEGGALVDYDGSIRLIELAEIPLEHRDDFTRKYKTFNTNNLWISIKAIKRVIESGGMHLPIIEKFQDLPDGRRTVQLETAAGASISYFKNAHGVHVSRTRFLPVKNTSDLLLLKSDLYTIDPNGQIDFSRQRMFENTPTIKLGDQFRTIEQFQKRLPTIPNIIDLDHLTVTGDVHFGRSVTLRGTVVVSADEGQRIEIPDGTVLENKLLSGTLNMIKL